ncbi:hypothetical protein MZJ48_002852 [Vibrio parahaemolyticus]|nr:hypothetical protein [Vibrio parahaemolyticus]
MGDYADFCEMYGGSAGDPDFMDEWLEKYAVHDDSEDDEELEWYLNDATQSPYDLLNEQLNNIDTLLEVDVPESAQFSLFVMLHAHVVSAMEGYLAGVFIQYVTSSDELTRKLVETTPEFSQRKFTLQEIYEKQSMLKTIVATYLKDLIFHDLKKVKPMYKAVLGHEFKDISWLFEAVRVRHDCVHRAGYDKEGKKVDISKESIMALLDKVESLSTELDGTVEKLVIEGVIV